jgi:hypothetical protein
MQGTAAALIITQMKVPSQHEHLPIEVLFLSTSTASLDTFFPCRLQACSEVKWPLWDYVREQILILFKSISR